MDKKTVVLLNGETIQSLSIAKNLKKSGYCVGAICDDKVSYGYHNKHISWKVLAPSIHDKSDEFHKFFIEFLKKKEIDVIIPMNDYSAEYMSAHKEELKKYTNFIIPDYDIFIGGYDKNRLMALCSREGFPHPLTFDLSVVPIETAGEQMRYPALIKPNITTGGRGFAKVNNKAELMQKYPAIKEVYGECHVQEFIPAGGRQFKIELFRSKDGRIVNSTVMHKVRFYPENGGSSCCSISIINDELVNICSNVLHKLSWVGFADFDLIEDPRNGEIKIMEINPRVPACVRLSLVSGVDFATMIADLSLNKPIKTYNYNPGKVLRYMALDALWFLYSSRRFSTQPSWFKIWWPKTYWQEAGGGFYSLFVGSLSGLIKQLNPSFRKAKAGLRE